VKPKEVKENEFFKIKNGIVTIKKEGVYRVSVGPIKKNKDDKRANR